MSPENDTLTTGSVVPAFFGVSAYDFGAERIFFGRRVGQTVFGIQTFNGFGAVNSSVSAVATNATTTLVAKVDYVTNRLRLYVNPNFSAAEPATASAELLNYTSTNWSTAVRLGSGAGQAVAWDRLVVATTWEELGAAAVVVTTTADNDDGSLDPALGGGAGEREPGALRARARPLHTIHFHLLL